MERQRGGAAHTAALSSTGFRGPLAGLDQAGPLAANWLRTAVDAIAERQLERGVRLVWREVGRIDNRRGLGEMAELAQLLRFHRITILWLTAGLFHAMVDEQLDSLSTVRCLLAGGDVLSPPQCGEAPQRPP